MQPVLLLNPFIAGQLPLILNQIQELAICQYVVPFSSVRLQVMTRNMIHVFEPSLRHLRCRP